MKQSAFPPHSIAIVGLAGRFPGAGDLDEFWRNVRDGVEALEPVSDADLDAAGVDALTRASPQYVRQATVLQGADLFDAAFFGISPRDAQILDPQQRVFLECAWEALENAGYGGDTGHQSVGVYGGVSMNSYLLHQILANPELALSVGSYQIMLASDKDFMCTRVSYKLDLRGPSVTIQTACSTSLVAVVMACRALARGECDIALSGASCVTFPQKSGYLYQEGMILSPDGHCRPFDINAGGTRAGSGCGIVVLKRLADALADGDTIHAVIRGAAMNNDGAGKAGFTAPSVDGQVEVIATALALAGVEPREVGYVEAHGTGTPLGDPIEIAALTQVHRASSNDVGYCRIGSLKANLGHLDAAAGVAGLIKATLVLENQHIPPLVNFTRPNPQLALESSPFVASATATPWSATDAPRRAAVSSFGIGGTNAHVVLEEAPKQERTLPPSDAHLIVLSAKTPAALDTMTANLARHLEKRPDLALDDVEFTLQVGRRAFPNRRAVVAANRAQLLEALAQPQRAPVASAVYEGTARPVAFLFSGQGSQHFGMGARLYAQAAVYREAVDRCASLLQSHLGADIRELMFSGADRSLINQTRYTQPALFVTEYALAQLWKSWGVVPAAMLGHSIGELVAAHIAGVFSLEDALNIVAARGRLMQSMPAGSMAAVHLPAGELKSKLPPGVEIAAVNAPGLCTISGPIGAIEETLKRFQSAGIDTRALHTSHAFHSAMMEPALAPFRAVFEGVTLSAPQIPYVSNVTGTWITPEQATSPAYYADHLRNAVLFEAGVRTIAADASLMLLETGPGDALTTLARLTIGRDGPKRVVQSLGRVRDEGVDAIRMREAAAKLWLAGVPLDFAALHAGRKVFRVPLPTYPFERKRFWVDRTHSIEDVAAHATGAPIPSRTPNDWLYASTWSRDESLPASAALSGTWLVLGDQSPLSRELVESIGRAGAHAVLVEQGADALARALKEHGAAITGAVHLWALGAKALAPDAVYDSLVNLGLGLTEAGATSAQVIHVSANAESLLGEPAPDPKSALALGPVLVLPSEYPGLRMRCVDFDAHERALDPQYVSAAVLREAAAEDAVRRVAWRGKSRWLRRYEHISLPAVKDARQPLKAKGVYLITGGLSGIGLTFARWLGEQYQARLLLTARSGLPDRAQWDGYLADHPNDRSAAAIAAIRAIEAAGGEVIVAAADVCDEPAMARAIESARRAWNAIDGVIHAAGISGDGRVTALQTPQAARAVFAPKVGGLDVLVRLLGTTSLEFVALMSSINALFGTPGNSDYSAANAVFDAFAEGTARPAAWRQVVSINWGPWREVGMAANLVVPEAQRAQWQAVLANAIPPLAGAEMLARGLASQRSRVIVVSYDLLAAVSSRESAVTPEETVAQSATGHETTPDEAPAPRPELSTTWEAPGTQTEQRLAAIWRELLGIDGIGRHDDFFELGGHSLLATRVLARVQDTLGARLTLREVFEAPTIHRMAGLVDRTGSAATDTSSEEKEEREEFEF